MWRYEAVEKRGSVIVIAVFAVILAVRGQAVAGGQEGCVTCAAEAAARVIAEQKQREVEAAAAKRYVAPGLHPQPVGTTTNDWMRTIAKDMGAVASAPMTSRGVSASTKAVWPNPVVGTQVVPIGYRAPGLDSTGARHGNEQPMATSGLFNLICATCPNGISFVFDKLDFAKDVPHLKSRKDIKEFTKQISKYLYEWRRFYDEAVLRPHFGGGFNTAGIKSSLEVIRPKRFQPPESSDVASGFVDGNEGMEKLQEAMDGKGKADRQVEDAYKSAFPGTQIDVVDDWNTGGVQLDESVKNRLRAYEGRYAAHVSENGRDMSVVAKARANARENWEGDYRLVDSFCNPYRGETNEIMVPGETGMYLPATFEEITGEDAAYQTQPSWYATTRAVVMEIQRYERNLRIREDLLAGIATKEAYKLLDLADEMASAHNEEDRALAAVDTSLQVEKGGSTRLEWR